MRRAGAIACYRLACRRPSKPTPDPTKAASIASIASRLTPEIIIPRVRVRGSYLS